MLKRNLIIVCLVTSLLLAACTSTPAETTATNTVTGVTTSATTTQVATTTAATTTTVTSTAATSAEEPKYGGTFTYLHNVSGTNPASWDPAEYQWVTNLYGGYYMENLFAGDLESKPRGTFSFQTRIGIMPDQTGPELAESFAWVDSNTLVFQIRKGVKFHNYANTMSKELTAADVAYSFTRMKSSPKYPKTSTTWVESITATGKYEVTVKTTKYTPEWASTLGWGYYFLVYPEETVNAANDGIKNWKNACGTGPFIVSDYVFGSMVTYVKNPNYWGTTTINGKQYQIPFVDKIQIPIITDISTKIAALSTGKADINDNVAWTSAAAFEKTKNSMVKITASPFTSYAFNFRLDKTELPTADIRVRQALSMAIDREGMLKTLYNDYGIILNIPMQPVWGESIFTPIDKLPADVQEVLTYDVSKAKQLLTEAGYGTGFTLQVIGSPTYDDIAALLINYWKAVGVTLEYKTMEYTTYLSAYASNQNADYQAIFYTHTGTTPTAVIDSFMLPNKLNNRARLNNPSIIEKYEAAISTTDEVEQAKLIREISVEYLRQVPVIPLPVANNYIYYWPWVKNYFGEVQVGCYKPAPVHARIWIDRDLKKKMGY